MSIELEIVYNRTQFEKNENIKNYFSTYWNTRAKLMTSGCDHLEFCKTHENTVVIIFSNYDGICPLMAEKLGFESYHQLYNTGCTTFINRFKSMKELNGRIKDIETINAPKWCKKCSKFYLYSLACPECGSRKYQVGYIS